MKFSGKGSTPAIALSRTQALACVPVVLPAIVWHRRSSGEIRIEYPLPLKPLLTAVFSRFSPQGAVTPTKKLELDTLGSQVWLMIDGTATVGDIIRRFARDSSITTQEAEQAVTAFLRELGKRGIVALREPTD